jgi:hypothetical protein
MPYAATSAVSVDIGAPPHSGAPAPRAAPAL